MNVLVEESSACRKKLRIEVPADQVKDQFDHVVGAYSRQVKVPGFRPGRAPRDLVRRRFGKEIEQEVRDRLIPKGYRD
ncbi:MAG: trigger factor family protein, partial [Akkermansiaceae bacterium]|nr:trigger factor family protein [Akkermansiaceae bacterium]